MREAGGAFGKLEAGREEEYFRKLVSIFSFIFHNIILLCRDLYQFMIHKLATPKFTANTSRMENFIFPLHLSRNARMNES